MTAISKKKTLAASLVAMLALVFACFTGTALAASSNDDLQLNMGRDYVFMGQSLNVSDASVENDMLAAGMSLVVDNSKVGGSMRMAARYITLTDVKVGENITLAAQSIIVQADKARTVALTGQDVYFTGTCQDFYSAGQTIVLNGVVNGDAHVYGNAITIGEDAVITGKLYIEANEQPLVNDKASIGDLKVNIVKDNELAEEAEEAAAGFSIMGLFGSILFAIPCFIAIAVLCEWLGRKRTEDAANMIKQRTGAHIATGVIAAIAAPIAIILLCIPVVTLPVAGALALALIAMTLIGGGFMAASLGKIAFPKMNRFLSAIIMAAILAVISILPFIGGLVTVLGFMYLLGYVIQRIFLGSLVSQPKAEDGTPIQPAQ